MRRNIVAVIAVCAALAIGLALGAGPLNRDNTAKAATTPTITRDDSALRAEAQEGDDFASAVGPALLKGRLAGQHVALVVLPGADDDTVTALGDGVEAAGGDVTSTLTLAGSSLDSGSRTLVDTLGVQLSKQLKSGVRKSDTTYVRFGEMVGLSVGTASGHGGELGTDQQTARASLTTAKLATETGGKTSAPLVLLVLGDDQSVDSGILAAFVEGVATNVHGVVVTGSAGSGADGDLKALRDELAAAAADHPVATVDGDDTAIGQTVAVLALVRQITGGGGSFGASGVDGFQPLA